MLERLMAVTLSQTGTAADAAWVVEFPFPTKLLGVKVAGSNVNDTQLAVSGGATITAADIGDSGDPNYLTPDSDPDYADADTAYTFTLDAVKAGGATEADDPLAIAYFLIGEGGTNLCGPGERIIGVTIMQTGNATTGAWVVEFPFPTKLVGIKAAGSNSNNSTIAVSGGATVSATAIGDSGDPEWITPDTTPDYADADTAYTVTLTQGATQADDPLATLFFAVGEGGSNFEGMGERVVVTTLLQTGNATTGAWVMELPIPSRLLGVKAAGSNTNTSTLQVAGGAAIAATQIGDDGDPSWLTPDTEPDYVDADTACTVTLTQTGSRADDPLAVFVWGTGEG